ncbi:hypothetical protein [Sabulicella rubraurantiaca]|uniref:hypothetical protein n=1 Tax=Sabulicella rubraurantiaca TaxID=2811429 RepID=UPI001A974EF5|nr:hypothetical protein [Sabulicella rubraurantiaca]
MITRRSLLGTLSVLVPTTASAHVPAGGRGPNGGQVQDVGPYHGELVARDGEIILFLLDHNDRPVAMREASGTAIVLSEERQQTLPLAPRPDGAALVAAGEFKATPGLRVVVQIVPRPGVARVQARFTPADPVQ